MKFPTKLLGETSMLFITSLVFLFTIFELLITINSGIWADYPVWMIGVVVALILSSLYLIRFFWKTLAN
jgi:hypothetical protein